jgi:tripartite-type tricarboxylate transporter receptor subunit TctC
LAASILIASFGVSAAATAQNAVNNLTKPSASTWPTKPVHILVGFPGGSTPDTSARTLAEGLSRLLGQPVIVENKPGASGNIAADMVAKANDDHTLGVVINGNLTSAKLLNPKLPFDPAKDFQFISLLTTAPLLLVTQASAPSGADFFTAAKAGGKQWNYGSVGNGSVAHLGMELLKSKAPGLQAVHIPFGGNPQVVTAMIGGQINLALIPPGVAMPQVRAGKLKAIGVTGGRSTLVPEVPPLTEAGINDFNLEVWTALIGPANLPTAVTRKLSEAVVSVLRQPETRQRLFNQGWQAVGTSPEGLALRVKQEAAQLGEIVRSRKITVE